MKSSLAVIASILIFIFCWTAIAGLLALMAWLAIKTEYASALVLLLNVLFVWVLSPGAGAAVAIYATTSAFTSVAASTIFVGFVSVWGGVLFVLGSLATISVMRGEFAAHQLLVMVFQTVAIFIGARFGHVCAVSSRGKDKRSS